jgi:hypothetical protein
VGKTGSGLRWGFGGVSRAGGEEQGFSEGNDGVWDVLGASTVKFKWTECFVKSHEMVRCL